jgi:hypothetical protein
VAYRREHDGAVALGSPVRTYEPYLLMHVSDRRDDWLVQAGLEMTDLNTVQVTAVQDGVTYPDASHWVSAPRRGTDDQLSVASLGGGAWFAIWRNDRIGLQLLTSAGASPPRGWDRLQAATSSITRSASLGRAGPRVEDGWIFTWVEPESTTGTADELRLIRLMPALPSGG